MIKRDIYKHVVDALKNKQIPLVMGLRRIGKTTLLKMIEQDNKNSIIISFDSFSMLKLNDNEFYELLKSASRKYDYLLLDEVQTRKDWDKMIKSLYDEFVADNLTKIVVTGSSSMILASKELGVNRTKRLIMETWGFDEYSKLTKKDKNFKNFETYLGKGGFPDYFNSTKELSEVLEETLKPIIEDDIPKAYKGVDTGNLIRFIYALSNLSNGEVNEAKLSNLLEIDIKTVRRYVDMLENARLLKRIYRINEKGSLGKRKRYKIYLNPHFHVMLLNKSFSNINDKFKGHIIESYWLHWAKSINGNWKEFYYLKIKSDDKEIDFVSKNPDGSFKTLHEFKYQNSISTSDIATMLKIKSDNKVLWSKETKDFNGVKEISILDIKNN